MQVERLKVEYQLSPDIVIGVGKGIQEDGYIFGRLYPNLAVDDLIHLLPRWPSIVQKDYREQVTKTPQLVDGKIVH